MQLKLFLKKADNLWAENKLLKMIIVIIGAATLFNSFMMNKALKQQRVIIMPPGQITERLEFEADWLSDSYIQMFSRYFSMLMFHYTPATVEKQFNELLIHVDPAQYDFFRKMLNRQIETIQTEKMISSFVFNEVQIKRKTKEMIISGYQKIGTTGRADQVSYRLKYSVMNGHIRIKEIKDETTH